MESFIKDKRLLWLLFAGMVLAQWLVPGLMIKQKHEVAKKGTSYKFELAAIDPRDLFRGKFIILNPLENGFVSHDDKLSLNSSGFATFKRDSLGLAKIKTLTNQPPETEAYLKVRLMGTNTQDGIQQTLIAYPFDRFYMNEHKALKAEQLISETISEGKKKSYAMVKILNGQYQVIDVMIDDKSIVQLLY